MTTRRALTLALALLLPVACISSGSRDFAPAVQGDPMGVVVHRLDNGLTVMISPNHEEPRFDAQITVRTGSHKDPAETTGLAHYLEHMLFKGTSRLGTLDWEAEKPHLDAITRLYDELFVTTDPEQRTALYRQIDEHNQAAAAVSVANEFDQIYDRWGGRGLNAFTSNDQTSYVINLPSNRLESWAQLESHRFEDPVFRLFQTEIEAVYEEKNRAMDNKDRVIWEAFMGAMFPQHTYGTQSTLGDIEHLKNPKISAMYDYFYKWYVPRNMVIALAGDLDVAATIATIERHFGDWEDKPVPADPQFPEILPEGRQSLEVTFKGEEGLMMGFRTVNTTHPDHDALVLCDMMMDNGKTGLINRNIMQKQLARSAGCSPIMWTYGGAQTFRGVPLPGQTLEQVEQLLLDQIAKLKAGEFTQDDLDAVLTDFEIMHKQGLESNETRVRTMTEAFIAQRPWSFKEGEIDRLRATSREQVIAAANRYFGDDYVIVFRRDGPTEVAEMPKPPFTPVKIEADRKSAFFQELAAIEPAPLEPHFVVEGRDFVRRATRAGELVHVTNPMNDLFQISLTYPIGTDDDPRLDTAFQLAGLAGAGDLSPVEYQRKLYALGSSIGGGAGAQETTITLTGLDAHLDETLALMRAHFTQPAGVGQGDVEKLVARTLGGRAVQKREARAINGALISYARWAERSPYLDAPTNDELKAYTADDLLPLIGSVFGYEAKIDYVGTRSVEEVAALFEGFVGDAALQKGDGFQPLLHVVPKGNRVLLVDEPSTNQSSVTFLGPDGLFDESIVPAVLTYNEYMSGSMGSVVFQEVRESRALAYTAWTNYRSAGHANADNLFTGALGTQTDKTIDAITVLNDIVRNMPAQPARFDQVKSSRDEHYRASRVGFREIPGVVRTWDDQGLSGDPRPFNWKAIQEMTFEELQAFAQRFGSLPMTITIVGNKAAFDVEALSRFGKVEELRADQLFNW